MQESKYEPVDKITLGPQPKRPYAMDGMEKLSLSTLKAENRTKEKDLVDQKKEIDKAIKSARENPLPTKTRQRFDREFGKQKEKDAFKTAMALFIVALAISFAIQPSIFFFKTGNGLFLANYSQRELDNVSVYSFNDFAAGNIKPVYFLQKLAPLSVMQVTNKETTVLVAFADRQMPAIGVYTPDSNQNINNLVAANNYKTGQTPQEMLNSMK